MAPGSRAVDVLSSTSGALVWCAATRAGDSVAALVEHLSNAGTRECFVLMLGPSGELLEARPLPTAPEISSLNAAILAAGGRVLVALNDRREERISRDGFEEVRLHDGPRFYDCGTPRRLRVREIAFWKDVAIRTLVASAAGTTTVWTMTTVKYANEQPEGRLAYAFGAKSDEPRLVVTDIPCETSASTAAPDGSIVALVGDAASMALWRVNRSSPAQLCGEVARARSRAAIVDPRIVRLNDGYVILWYVDRGRAGGVDTGLWARTCSFDLEEIDEPRRLVRDDDASWDEWRAFDLGGEAIVVWGQGMRGSRLRHLRLRARLDVDASPRSFPGKLPDLVLRTSAGLLVLTAAFSKKPYRWRLLATAVRL